jgi:hypothetical protein
LRLEARNYIGFPLGDLCFPVAQGIFSGVKSFSKVFDTSSFFFSLFASLLAGLKFFSPSHWRAPQQDAAPLKRKKGSGYQIKKKRKTIYSDMRNKKFTPQRSSFITEPDKTGAYIDHLLHKGL